MTFDLGSKDWMKMGIATYVAGIITYLVIMHTGTADGQIKPDLIYTFFTGVFATKIVDFLYNNVKKESKKEEV